ncbi:hypothetical protein ACFQ05_01115 [Amycolatopsis umgeniensis]|uniref:Uncharacterized protein n=1 Tax=Amycolatopsis umgeniensis TaxID=336628 RepID=A0A841AYA5_9PSEU|nr:hypothetical protein [Amycolatopsis umgeniensis]MBB5851853.1 hypothetical protein [Amycolatopsis umgeniensis]
MQPYGKPRANATAAVITGSLALLTAAMLVWFALYNVVYAGGSEGGWSGPVLQNVVGGIVTAGLLVVAAGFTFARRIAGAWTLFGLCAFYVVAVFLAAPLVWGTPFGTQVQWIFGFDKSNGVATALASVFGFLTAVMAAIAGSVRSYEKPRV